MKEKEQITIDELRSFHEGVIDYFDEKHDKGIENERYMEVESWTPEEKQQIESQNRQAYSMGIAAQKMNTIIAEQRSNRTEWRLNAKIDPNDEIKAEIGTVQFRDLEKRCNMKYVDSDVFASGSAISLGAYEIYLDTDEDENIVPSVRAVDYRDLIYDKNAISYEKNEAAFMAKKRQVYRYQIRNDYGKKAAEVYEGDTYNWGRKKESYFVTRGVDRDYDLITVFDHYQKVLRTYYYVMFNDYLNLNGKYGKKVCHKTRNKEEAVRYLQNMKKPYLKINAPLGANAITTKKETKIDKYVFTYERILEYEETDMSDFPFSLYYGYHFADKYWTVMDVLKSAQKFIDRYIAQIDYSFGKDIRNAYEIVVGKLAEGYTFEQALQRLEEDGVLPVKAENAINNVRSQGVNPQWMQMIQLMQTYLEDLAGGRSFQGLSEGADESGRAIKLKQQKGEMLASILIDNLSRTKRDLGKKLLWWFQKYDTNERIIKVGGGELSPQMIQLLQQNSIYTPSMKEQNVGYLRVNLGNTSHLQDAKLELEVNETALSETQRQKKQFELLTLAQTNPNMAQLPKYNELMLEYSGVNYTDRQALMEDYRQYLQAQAEAAKKEQEREDQKIRNDSARVLSSTLEKGENKEKAKEKK